MICARPSCAVTRAVGGTFRNILRLAQRSVDTVAAPIRAQINGVEDNAVHVQPGDLEWPAHHHHHFKLGTDLDKAQVLVQNRVAIAQPQLPEEVQRNGVVTKKDSPTSSWSCHAVSDRLARQLYISNYALLQGARPVAAT